MRNTESASTRESDDFFWKFCKNTKNCHNFQRKHSGGIQQVTWRLGEFSSRRNVVKTFSLYFPVLLYF